jgi:hypothetical protein
METPVKLTRSFLALTAALALAAGPAGAATNRPPLHMLDLSFRSTPAMGVTTGGAPNPGDRVFLLDELYAWKGGSRGMRIGHIASTLTFMSHFGRAGATVELNGQMFLRGGSLLVEGIGPVTQGRNHFTLPIIGGTGTYAGARGSIDLRDLGANGDRSDVAVHLLA